MRLLKWADPKLIGNLDKLKEEQMFQKKMPKDAWHKKNKLKLC